MSVDIIRKRIVDLNQTVDHLKNECSYLDKEMVKENESKKTAEADVAAMTRRIRLLEEDLEQSTSRLTETTEKLEEASRLAEESERLRKKLEERQIVFSQAIDKHETNIQKAVETTDENERRYQELHTKLESTVASLESTNKVASDNEKKIAELESTLNTMASQLKRSEIEQEKLTAMEEQYEIRLKLLKSQLEEASGSAKRNEVESQRRTMEIDRITQMLNNERTGYETLQKQFDSMVNEFRSA